MSDNETKGNEDLVALQHKRRGLKGSITKRITELKRLISENGSRTRIRFLYDKLTGVYTEMATVAGKVYSITKQYADEEWLQQETVRVDDISSEITEYFESRKDDAPSDESLTATWVQEHASDVYVYEPSEKDAEVSTTTEFGASQLGATASASHTKQQDDAEHATASSKHDLLYSLLNTVDSRPSHPGTGTGYFGDGPIRIPPSSLAGFTHFREHHDHSPLSSASYHRTSDSLHHMSDNNPINTLQLQPSRLQEVLHCNNDFTIPTSMLPGHYSSDASARMSMLGTRPRTSYGVSSIPGSRPLNHIPISNLYVSQVNEPGTSKLSSISNFNTLDPNANIFAASGVPTTRTGVPVACASGPSMSLPTHPTHMRMPFSNTATTHVVGSSGYVPPSSNPSHVTENFVDSWIDLLDVNRPNQSSPTLTGIAPDVTMAYLVQQNLPRTQLPTFDGCPTKWVNFVTKFRDVVHFQQYLTDTQRCLLLVQHLEGPAERSVTRFTHDSRGYVLALRRLKFLFGQKSKIAQATLREVTEGDALQPGDRSGLSEFYYTISDCLVTLRLLNYVSDLFSSDTLRQAVRRLPVNLVTKWAETSVNIRGRGEEPNLIHFEEWLQRRVLVLQEIEPREERQAKHLSRKEQLEEKRNKIILATQTSIKSCPTCDGKHPFWKCKKYESLVPKKRFDAVMNMRRCWNCLAEGHEVASCASTITCRVAECKGKHHTTLHDHFKPKTNSDDNNEPQDVTVSRAEISESKQPKRVFLQIVPVMLHSETGESVHTYGLLDNAADATLIRKDIARKLKIRGKPESIMMNTIKDKPEEVHAEQVTLDISAKDGSNRFTANGAFVLPVDKFRMPSRPRLVPCTDDDFYTHLDGIDLDAIKPSQVGILIGADNPRAVVSDDVKCGRRGQPIAVHTLFGWTLFGGVSTSNITINCVSVQHSVCNAVSSSLESFWTDREPIPVNVNTVSTEVDELLIGLEKFFKIEQDPIAERETAMSQEDVKALEKLEKETVLLAGRYQAPMLWREPTVQLPNNLPLAKRRFSMLLKRLRGDSELCAKYKAVIDRWIERGYARKLTAVEANEVGPRTWTLPTFPVFHPHKPNKVRVVHDAAAVFQGTNLNKELITGPDLLNSLHGVLLRFRVGRVAICADVEDMFWRILTTKEDSESLRFLWKENIHDEKPPDTYKFLVHIMGAKDSPTIANYIVKRIARDNFQKFDALTYETMVRSFYVDDCLKSVDSESVGINLSKQLTEMLKLGGLRLTKFVSNCKAVLDALPPSDVSPNVSFDIDVEKLERALGVKWNTLLDVFTFSSTIKVEPTSKRGILRISFSIFDPLGFLAPFILIPKLLLQLLWVQGRDWDDGVDSNIQNQWQRWLDGCKRLSEIQIDRCYLKDARPVSEIQLHNFCDASEAAYGAVSYLRFSFKSGGHATSFVMSKSKVAPTTAITLPRLELNSAVVSCRLFRLLIAELDLPIENVFFWTDATLVIQYIGNKRHRFKTYVANRVTEIIGCSRPEQWRHVSGSINPADLVTRGVTDPTKLLEPNKEGTSWFGATAFLKLDEEFWPVPTVGELDVDNEEIRKQSVFVCLTYSHIQKSLIDAYRFSSWPKLKRVAAWFLRFLNNVRTKLEERCFDDLHCEELRIAEIFIINDVQKVSFQDELRLIRTNEVLPKSSQLISLSPFIDTQGVLRVGGRLRNAPISEESKHPIILPNNHPVTKIIVSHEHVTNGHIGQEHTLSNLRSSYWIISGRTVVKNVIRNCFLCQIRRAIRMYPYMSDLPGCRVAFEEPPFCNCGVDLFGPISVKQGRKRLKRWGVIFTCLTIRCIHLEVVEMADTDAFINSFRRFTNRRGCPQSMYSDCGTNFQGAANELEEFQSSLNREKIGRAASEMNIAWEFNPPASPHMGGAWERLIRSVKEVMYGIMKNRVLTDPQLLTLFTEVENIVNSRPLTHISDDINDLRALTPNHILLGMHRNWGYVTNTCSNDITSRKKWRQVQAARESFWIQWKTQYLPTLTKRGKWKVKTTNLKVGELVLLDDDSPKRRNWPLARVTKVLPGKDGTVRVAEIRTKDGTYTRPVAKLLRLEDDIEVPQGEGNVDDSQLTGIQGV